jgi:hypothetical protein
MGIGFLVKSAPDLIAGYNTMSEDKKKNVDIKGLSNYLRNGLIVIGLTTIFGYFLLKWIGFSLLAHSMILVVPITGIAILVIRAQKFDHNKAKKTKLTALIFVLVVLFVIGLMTYGLIPAKAHFDSDTVRFSGMYGLKMNISDIEQVELAYEIPAIKMRTNGFSFGTVKKGFFKIEGLGRSRLLIHSDQPPYLIISKKDGKKTIINFKDKATTESVYIKIKALLNK